MGFVKFELKQWFSFYQDQGCAWFSLAQPPTETAQKNFLDHFLKESKVVFILPILRSDVLMFHY